MNIRWFVIQSIKLITIIFLIDIILLLLFSLRIKQINNSYAYSNWATESSVLIIPESKQLDLVFMGNSHGRIFSRNNNHLRVEKILGRKFLNLSIGNGGGIVPEKVFLDTFYEKGNKAKLIIYFIEPWIFYTDRYNEKFTFPNEPIDLNFMLNMVKEGIDQQFIVSYFKDNWLFNWVNANSLSTNKNTIILKRISEEDIKSRLLFLYPDKPLEENYLKYTEKLKQLVVLTQKNNSKIVFIIPTNLIKLPYQDKLVDFMTEFKKQNNVGFYDFSTAIKELGFYYDLDHLNSDGVEIFTKNYLKPLIEKEISQ